jgi:hypothetical protein
LSLGSGEVIESSHRATDAAAGEYEEVGPCPWTL